MSRKCAPCKSCASCGSEHPSSAPPSSAPPSATRESVRSVAAGTRVANAPSAPSVSLTQDPVGERRRSRRGRTGPRDHLALGASHTHIAVVAVADDVISAAVVADTTALHDAAATNANWTELFHRVGPLRKSSGQEPFQLDLRRVLAETHETQFRHRPLALFSQIACFSHDRIANLRARMPSLAPNTSYSARIGPAHPHTSSLLPCLGTFQPEFGPHAPPRHVPAMVASARLTPLACALALLK